MEKIVDWGKSILSIRDKHNFSQEELAEQLGTNQATISRWERGLSKPTFKFQKKLISLYGEPQEKKVDPKVVSAIAQSMIDSIRGYGAVIYDRNELCIAASANQKHKVGKSILENTPAWEHKYYEKWRQFSEEVDFWNTPLASFEYTTESQPRQDIPPRTVRFLLTSIVICDEVYCLVHSKTDDLDII